MSCGRVDNLAVVMGLHPDYLSRFWRLHYLLLHTDGPLASSWRHYIAIMVSLSDPESPRVATWWGVQSPDLFAGDFPN